MLDISSKLSLAVRLREQNMRCYHIRLLQDINADFPNSNSTARGCDVGHKSGPGAVTELNNLFLFRTS